MWQIEQTKTLRSVCRDCHRLIPRGAYRFGNYELDRWYHLECAAVRNSRAFGPFAQQAAALMSPAPAVATRAQRIRNAELEARLVAQPDDATLMAVFADWLQSVDDPWGDLIALELAGREAAAKEVLRRHLDDLIGECAPRMFAWRRGFIDKATLDVLIPSTNAKDILDDVFALRTAMILRELHVPLLLRPDALTVINEQAPRTVRHLFMWFTNNIQFLALPNLERLTVYMTPYAGVEVATIEPFLAATRLPRLSRIKISGRALPLAVVSAFLDSKLLRQLVWLEITDGALDDAGEALVARRRADLAHIPVLNFSLALDDVFPTQKTAWLARHAEG